jgi:AcrR family transcriptional regulator
LPRRGHDKGAKGRDRHIHSHARTVHVGHAPVVAVLRASDNGTGLREVVAHSGGPRGSLGRFFPGGKTQLVTEAIDVALAELFGDLERTLGDAETFPEAIRVIVAPWRRLLVDHNFALGCPLAATICDSADPTASVPMSASRSTVGERRSPTPTQGSGRRRRKPKHTRRCLWLRSRVPSYSLALNGASTRSTQSSASSRHALQTDAEHRKAQERRAQRLVGRNAW